MPISLFGAFSEPGYLAVADPYDKPKPKDAKTGAFKVRRVSCKRRGPGAAAWALPDVAERHATVSEHACIHPH